MFQGWITFEGQFDKYYAKHMKSKELGKPRIILVNEKKRIDDYLYRDKRLKEVITLLYKRYKLTEEFVKSHFLPSSDIFNLPDEEIIFKMDYWIKFFGNKTLFFEAVRNETIYQASPYSTTTGFFSKKDVSFANERLQYLMETFGFNEKSALLFITDNIYYFEINVSFFEKKLSEYAELLSTDNSTIKKICARYPSAFYSRVERLEEKIVGLANAFSIDIGVAKNAMLKFPPLIQYQITQIRNFKSTLSKHINDYANILVKYPYIINLFDIVEKKYYGLFDNFSDLLADLDFVEQNVGTIEDVIVRNSKLPILLVKTFNLGYCACCFGLKQYAPNKNGGQYDIKTFVNSGRTIACISVSGYENRFVNEGVQILLNILK